MVSTPPAPTKAYVRAHCPAPGAASSQVEWNRAQGERVECLEKAMNAELDRVLLPLKKSDPNRFHLWMELQARFNQWAAAVCDAQEELRWVDVKRGQRSTGTAAGETRQYCQERLFASRGWFAAQLADGKTEELHRVWLSQQREGEARWDALQRTIADVQAAIGRPVPKPVPNVLVPVTHEQWRALLGKLETAMKLGNELGRTQCTVLSPAPKDCSAFYPNALFFDVHLDASKPEVE